MTSSDLAQIHRHVNILNESTDRRKLTESLKFLDTLVTQATPQNAALLLKDSLAKPLLNVLSHQTESVRELGLRQLTSLVQKSDDIAGVMPLVCATLTDRLASQKPKEPAEEIRLLLVAFLKLLITKLHKNSAPFIRDFSLILKQTLVDSFPDVLKESCKCIVALDPDLLKHHAPEMVKHLGLSLSHRHAQVRIHGLEATKNLILAELDCLDTLSKQLWLLSRDKSASVRGAFYDVIAFLALNLRDRYGVTHKILPWLLSGLEDDIAELTDKVKLHLDSIGILYEKDWYTLLTNQRPDRVRPELQLLPLNSVPYPRVGTCHVFKDCILKTVDVCVTLFSSWTLEEREQSIGILYHLIEHVKDSITGYTTKIVSALMKGYTDEPSIIKKINRTCQLLGSFVLPSVYLESCLSSYELCDGAVLKSSSLETLKNLLSGSIQISDVSGLLYTSLCNKEIWLDDARVQQAAVDVMLVVLDKQIHRNEVDKELHNLFDILIKIKALSPSVERIDDAFALHGNISAKTVTQVYYDYMMTAIDSFVSSCPSWSKHSPQLKLFAELVSGMERVSAFSAKINQIVRISLPETQKELYLIMKTCIHKGLEINAELIESLMLGCVWKGGKFEAEKRRECLECFSLLISSSIPSQIREQVVSSILGNVDDDFVEIRKAALQCLDLILQCFDISGMQLRDVNKALLERLDDSDDSLRIKAVKLMGYVLGANFKLEQQMKFDTGIMRHLFETVLVHMDDPDLALREAVYGLFINAKHLLSTEEKLIIVDLLGSARKTHRHQSEVNRLLQAMTH